MANFQIRDEEMIPDFLEKPTVVTRALVRGRQEGTVTSKQQKWCTEGPQSDRSRSWKGRGNRSCPAAPGRSQRCRYLDFSVPRLIPDF